MNRRFVRSLHRSPAPWHRPWLLAFRIPLGSKGALQPASLAHLNPEEFQAELVDLEASVQKLRQYFDEVCRIRHQQKRLGEKLANPALPAAELQDIHRQLETLEADLMSATLPWQTLVEPFWQGIRFGGLGLVIGWVLKGIVQS